MTVADNTPRPSDLARLWLAALGGPPRQRPRDQRADLAGIELLRQLLDRLASLDPEPNAIEPALAEAAASLSSPDGPARALAALVRDQWHAFAASPATAAWLLAEALEQSSDPPPRRRRDSPTASVGPLHHGSSPLPPGEGQGEGASHEMPPPLAGTPTMWARRNSDPDPAVAAALASLDRLATDRPELADPARTLARALAAAFDQPIPATLDAPADAASPLFHAHPPAFDPDDLRRRGTNVARALEPDNPSARLLRHTLDAGTLDLAPHLAATCAGHNPPPLPASLDATLVDSVARLLALPALAPLAGSAIRNPQSAISCPLCDSPPLLAEARGLEQHRVLRCGLCAAAWPMPRLDCPACAAAKLLVYHVVGEEQKHRLLTCPDCGLRLKLVTTLLPLTPPALLVADLATVHLDLIAHPGKPGVSNP